MKEHKLKYFIFKCIGFLALIIGFLGLFYLIKWLGDFSNTRFLIGVFMFSFGMFFGLLFLILGFKTDFLRLSIKRFKKIQKENSENIKDIYKISKDFASEIIKENEVEKAFCNRCNKIIDSDSEYCKYCGNKQ